MSTCPGSVPPARPAGRRCRRGCCPPKGRQPHVTIRVCGFPALQVHEPDDFGFDELAAQTAALARARIAPFHIEIGAGQLCIGGLHLGVGDPEGGIAALRRTLGEVSDADVKAHPPHVTFALYRGAFALPGSAPPLAPLDPPAAAPRHRSRALHAL